jgi:ribosome-associated protein
MTEESGGSLLRIAPGIAIRQDELTFRFSRSTGPGGQNVNRRETQVELTFDVRNSPSVSPDQRARLLQRLVSHIDSRGVLHIVANTERSQLLNRREALGRLASLLRSGLEEPPRRHRTRPSLHSRLRRLSRKRRRSEVKHLRRTSRQDMDS